MRFRLLPAATLALFLCAFLAAAFFANTAARADLAIIGANSDGPDHFAFVALGSYAPGAVIKFTDSSYGTNDPGLATKFRWTEHFLSGGPLSLTVPAAGLSLGQVVVFNSTLVRFERPDGSAFGATAGAAVDFGNSGDNLFAYFGTVVEDVGSSELYRGDTTGVTSFQGAFVWGTDGAGGGWRTSGAGSTSSSYLPASPNTPFNFAFTSSLDNVRYNGSRTFSGLSAFKAALTDPANWTGHGTTVTTPSGFGGDFVVAVPEASAVAFGSLAGLGGGLGWLWGRRRGR
jgi:hypothetical protein